MRSGPPIRSLALAALLAVTFPAPSALAAADVDLQAIVDGAYAEFKDVREGENADYIPILARVDPELFSVVITTVDGRVYAAGDADHVFSIQSVSKPFTMALVMQQQGRDAVVEKIGVEPTGMPFNSIVAIELNNQRSINPMVNAGAIAAVSMLDANGSNDRWKQILDGYGAFAGEPLELIDEVYTSEAESNYRNRAIANLLFNYGRLYSDPLEATDVYTRQCSVGVTARQLAMMGATLANYGLNPKTGARVLNPDYVDEVLAVMLMAGFYDEVGIWAYEAGLPAKTGVGGGIVAVVPGRMAIVSFSPRLNAAGNSVRALKAIESISNELSLSLFKRGEPTSAVSSTRTGGSP